MYMKFQCLLFSINTFISIAEIQLPSVFISYRRLDKQKEFKEKFIQQLEKRKITVWIDARRIAAGENVDQTIADAIIRSDIFFCVLSDTFFASKYCRNEFDFAHNAKKKLFPIRWNNSSLPDWFKDTYDGVRHHDYNSRADNRDAELQKCVDEFMKIVDSKLYNIKHSYNYHVFAVEMKSEDSDKTV